MKLPPFYFPYEPSTIFKATSFSASNFSLSFIKLTVSLVPSFPYNGDELAPTVIDIIGGSIGSELITSVKVGSFNVCPTRPVASPAIDTISPATAFCISI